MDGGSEWRWIVLGCVILLGVLGLALLALFWPEPPSPPTPPVSEKPVLRNAGPDVVYPETPSRNA